MIAKQCRDLITNNADKAEILNTSFASVCTGVAGRQVKGSTSYDNTCANLPGMEEGLVYRLLQGLNLRKPMRSVGVHSMLLREMADIVSRLLYIIFEKLWRSGDIYGWKRTNVIPVYKKGPKEARVYSTPFHSIPFYFKGDPGNFRPGSYFSPWKNNGMRPPRNYCKPNEADD